MLFEICWIFAVHLKQFAEELFQGAESPDYLSKHIDFFMNAINVQGNDKLLWLLLQYFEGRERLGDASPEENLINNLDLRSAFIQHINSR